MALKIKGLIAAAFTPLDDKGDLNLNVIPSYYEFLRKNGVIGVFINGTSGEAFSLTTKERKKITEAWVNARKNAGENEKDFILIAQVGATGIKDEIELAKHLKSVNVDGFSSMAPLFFKPTSVTELLDHLKKVAGSNPELPYYYYHIPQISGVDLPMHSMLHTLQNKEYTIPNFAGIKFSFPNFYDYLDCQVKYGKKYDMPFCSDQIILSALPLGAVGSIGSTYNYSAPLTYKVMQLFKEGKVREARDLEGRFNNLLRVMRDQGTYFGIAKELLKRKGLDLGRVRSPLKNLDELEKTPKDVMSKVENYLEKTKLSDLLNSN